MINLLRKNQKGLWIVIALLCIPFVFYFSNSKVGPIGANQFGRIYGRAIPIAEFQRSVRLFNLARELGMFTLLQEMVAGAQSETEAYSEFTWNRLILQHEAERLGIQPSAGEIAEVVKGLYPFRGQAGFDLNKYTEFTQNVLPSLGFTESQVEELAASQLILQRIKNIVGVGVHLPESESRENFERAYGKMNVAVVRLNAEDLAKDVQVSDEEIAKYYEAHQAELKSPEKRKVTLVNFRLADEQKKLTGKEHIEALQKLADQANEFTQALHDKGADFAQLAAKFNLPVQTTGDFTRSAPDPLLQGDPKLVAAAFQLTAEEPNSEATQAADGFSIMHLAGVEAAQPLALEAAKPQIVNALKNQRVQELVATKAAAAAATLRDALKAGQPLDAALAKTGLPHEKLSPFALADQAPAPAAPGQTPAPETPDLQTIKGTVSELSPGEVSEFVPTAKGGLVAVLEKREQPEAATYEAGKQTFNNRYLDSKREVAFFEWLRERRREAGAQMQSGVLDAG